MRFSIFGRWKGRDATVTWDDGRLDGPPDVVDVLRLHASLRRSGLGPPLTATPDGPVYDHAGLRNPMTMLLLSFQLFDRVDAIGSDDGGPRLELRANGMLRSVGPNPA